MILDGKAAAAKLFETLAIRIQALPQTPALAVIQVGNNPASSTYIRLKQKTLKKLGLDFQHIHLPEEITHDQVAAEIRALNSNPAITGILLQLPLPSHLDARQLLNLISPSKDPDCLTTENLGKFFVGESMILPATPLGVLRLLEFYNIPVTGKRICIIGRSNLVGKPLAVALMERGATITVCHSKTRDIADHTITADIVITAVGKADFFDTKYFKPGKTVIDVGTSLDASGKISGDVDYDTVFPIVKNITPVPGGVGPMTIYGLMENLVTLSE